MRRNVDREQENEKLIQDIMHSKFKANKKIAWTSTVKMYQIIQEKEQQKRDERKAARAIIMKNMADKQA